MINCRKGNAHSLAQSDVIGFAVASEGVVAGMICRIENISGVRSVKKGNKTATTNMDTLLGFAINNQTDGDVIESKKIGLYVLDGNSVIETDQVTGTIDETTFPPGTRIRAELDGTVGAWTTGDRLIGISEGVRALPSSSVISGYRVQATTPCLAVKLVAA